MSDRPNPDWDGVMKSRAREAKNRAIVNLAEVGTSDERLAAMLRAIANLQQRVAVLESRASVDS